ncbi:MAG: glycosyltransferase family 9 protein [Elusimicrobia bacterium]|nr:glycosyltransferase family 9 protein [Elusimicrobiota bacterium]
MPNPNSILIIQLRRIGDVILTTPAVEALKSAYPQAQIDFLAERPAAEALEGNPHLREVLIYEAGSLSLGLSWMSRIRSRGYDWVIDYMGNPRTALLTALSGAMLKAGPGHVFHRWAYNRRWLQSAQTQYSAREKVLALRSLGVSREGEALPRLYFGLGGRPENLMGLIPSSRRKTRRWPARSFVELGRELARRHGCGILVFWGPGERELAQSVAAGIGPAAQISPATPTLKALAEQIARCRLIVSNCNGPKHIAVALGIPTVTIHGSSDPKAWTPPHPSHRSVRKEELHCIGCRLNECPYDLECMNGLEPRRVLEAVSSLPAERVGS